MYLHSLDRSVRSMLLAILCLILLTSCSGQTGKRSGQGAATGAAAGAVGGMVSALIFGGNVGEAAARGAVWGGSAGAVSGAIAGSQEDKAIKKREIEQTVREMKTRFGDDAYSGLVALVQCKYPVALGYAGEAQKLSTRKYALAGIWLETLTYADQGDKEKVASMSSRLVSADPEIVSQSDIPTKIDSAIEGLVNIRKEHFNNTKCTR